MLEDVDLADAEVVRRVASVAVTAASDDARVLALGDAALGRDALASQGTAIGLSDARLAAGPTGTSAALRRRHRDGLDRHLRHLAGTLDACHHRRAPAWTAYRHWVDERRAPARVIRV